MRLLFGVLTLLREIWGKMICPYFTFHHINPIPPEKYHQKMNRTTESG